MYAVILYTLTNIYPCDQFQRKLVWISCYCKSPKHHYFYSHICSGSNIMSRKVSLHKSNTYVHLREELFLIRIKISELDRCVIPKCHLCYININ